MWCLLSDSPWISDEECDRLDDNRRFVVERGRDPALTLIRDGESTSVREWGEQIFTEMAEVARLLDAVEKGTPHADALEALAPRLKDPELTPSAQLLAQLQAGNGSLSDTLLELAQAQADELKAKPMQRSRESLLAQLIDTSHQQQHDIEADDQVSFDEFLRDYFDRARESRALSALPSEKKA